MNYREAMRSPDAEAWKAEIKNEYDRFSKYKAFTVVPIKSLPKGTKILTTTWAMKKKTSGKLRGRLNVRGYEQLEGEHYFADSIAAPVTNPSSVRILWTLWVSNPKWVARILDVEGAFL